MAALNSFPEVDDEEARNIALSLIGRLKEKREKLGYSKRKVAALAGLDPKAITFLERGERIPSVATLLRLADALDVELSEEFRRFEPSKDT
jgi:transcriptional regulator with XRE-family HTH domain